MLLVEILAMLMLLGTTDNGCGVVGWDTGCIVGGCDICYVVCQLK